MDYIQNSLAVFRDAFLGYSGGSKLWLLYPVALLVILLFGKKEDRSLFIGSIVVQCLLLLNPFALYFLKLKFRINEVRSQRFFWVLLFFITIAYAIVLLASVMKTFWMKLLVLAASAGMILFLGTPVFSGEDGVSSYITASNVYYVSDEIPALNAIFHSEGLERPKILYGMLMLTYRQYDPTVRSVFDRPLLISADRKKEEKFLESDSYPDDQKELAKVYFYEDYSVSVETFYDILKEYDCDYVVSETESLDIYLKEGSFHLMGETTLYRVWKVD